MITKPKKKISKRNPRESHISGYPVLYLDKNDNVFCAECAKESFTQHPYWEGSPVECKKCGEMIESAYGDPEKSKKKNPTKKVAKRTTKKKVVKRRNPDVSIRDIEDFLKKDMSTNPNHYPPSSAYRAIIHFKLDTGDNVEDNWITDLAWQLSEKLKYDKDRTMARKSKKGTNYGSLGIGNSPFKK